MPEVHLLILPQSLDFVNCIFGVSKGGGEFVKQNAMTAWPLGGTAISVVGGFWSLHLLKCYRRSKEKFPSVWKGVQLVLAAFLRPN